MRPLERFELGRTLRRELADGPNDPESSGRVRVNVERRRIEHAVRAQPERPPVRVPRTPQTLLETARCGGHAFHHDPRAAAVLTAPSAGVELLGPIAGAG